MKTLYWTAVVLTVIGAINWGFVGLFQVDLVATLFGGPDEPLSRIVYTLVGLAGIVLAATALALDPDVRAAAYRRDTTSPRPR